MWRTRLLGLVLRCRAAGPACDMTFAPTITGRRGAGRGWEREAFGGAGDDMIDVREGNGTGPDDVIDSYNPVGFWRLGETSGTTAADETGTSNGTYTNGVTLGTSGPNANISDTAASFDGVDDQVVIGYDPSYSMATGTVHHPSGTGAR